jgi:hypothetical protein
MEMNYHRGLLFWGLALITGGGVALAAQQGYIDHDTLVGAWRLWPLILVAIGLSIMLGRTPVAIVGTLVAALVVGVAGGALIAVGPGAFSCGGPDPTDLATQDGTFGDPPSTSTLISHVPAHAVVALEFNCGTLDVSLGDGDEWTVETGQTGDSPARIDAASDRLEVRSPEHDWFDSGRQLWHVHLPRATRYELEITPNAADTTVDLGGGTFTSVSIQPNAGSVFLDLTDAQVENLDLSLNAGSASIVIGSGLHMNASLSVNAGSIEVCTVGDVALQITTDPNITFANNLDETDLTQVGDSWSSDGYADASDRVHIDLEGNAASFDLNLEGGCS